MKKLIFFSILLLSVLSFISCTQDEIMTYTTDDNIYFGPSVEANEFTNGVFPKLVDSTGFSFSLLPESVTTTIFKIPIRIQGNVSNVDRPVKVGIDPDSSVNTAIEGVHYVMPTNTMIKAGRSIDTIYIQLNRVEDLKNNSVTLVLKLEDNEFFKTNMKTYLDPTSLESHNTINYKVTFDDILKAPKAWSIYSYGKLKNKKLNLMCSVLHLEPTLFNNSLGSPGLTYPETSYYRDFMRRYIEDQTKFGNIILEDDGTPMTFFNI